MSTVHAWSLMHNPNKPGRYMQTRTYMHVHVFAFVHMYINIYVYIDVYMHMYSSHAVYWMYVTWLAILLYYPKLAAGALQRLSNRASANTAMNLQILATRNCIIVMPYPCGSMSIHLFTRVYPTFFHIVMLFNADGLQMAYSHVAPGHQQTCC